MRWGRRKGRDEITQNLAGQTVQLGTILDQLACMAHQCSGKCRAPRPPNVLTLVETGSRSGMWGRGSLDNMATEERRMVSRPTLLTWCRVRCSCRRPEVSPERGGALGRCQRRKGREYIPGPRRTRKLANRRSCKDLQVDFDFWKVLVTGNVIFCHMRVN